VFWNLFANAVKFTEPGGKVDARLDRDGDSGMRFSIKDSGRGIAQKFLPHVFDRFRQADSTTTRSHGGLGLGLAIVRHLAELHGGTARVESRGENMGTTFSVSLPPSAVLAEERKSRSRPSHRDAAANGHAALDGVRVLVVDDEQDARKVISTVLTQSGAEVHAFEFAGEALEEVERWMPDVIMSDIGMPGEDGYALIRKLRDLPESRGGRIPAAALTAYARDEDRERALAAGYQKHIAKPVRSAELVGVVADLARV